MSAWQPIETAPKDGTWLKVRGWDFNNPGGRRHYAIAYYDYGVWNEVGSVGGQLQYLTDWRPLSEEFPK